MSIQGGSGGLAGSGQGPALNSSLASLWKKKPCGTVHRTQDSPSRARPRSPAAGNAAGGVAGEGGAGRGVGSPPGEHGAYSESSAAATGAASPRQRGTSRNGCASGDRMRGSAGQPWASGTHSPHTGRLVASGCLQEPLRRRECVWVLALCFLLGHERVSGSFLWGKVGRLTGLPFRRQDSLGAG